MEQVFGAITPFMVMMIITLLTQWVKSNFMLTPRQIQLVALGFSVLFIPAFQFVFGDSQFNAVYVFGSVIYSLLGWFSAIGMYEVASKQLARSQGP